MSRERDALALRLRLERALAGADFHPPGLPASAILCVRRLSDRRAGAPRALTGGAPAFAEWQRSVAAAIERLVRHAASPARGPVPADAEAVIFGDQAELLACLAADWCEEAAPARWWWRSLFGGLDAAAAMLSAWLGAPEHVPAALGRLGAAGRLIPFARALGENEARSIRRRVVEKFGLYELAAALDPTAAQTGTTARAGAERPEPPAEPWARYVPELRGYALAPEQSCMAGVGLMLLRAPSRVRSSPFAESVGRWRFGPDAPPSGEAARPGPRPEVEAHAPHEAGAEAPPAVSNVGREAPTFREGILGSGEDDEGESLSLHPASRRTPPRARVEHEGAVDGDSSARPRHSAEDGPPTEAGDRVGLVPVGAGAEPRPAPRRSRSEERVTESESWSPETAVNDSVEGVGPAPAPPAIQAHIQTGFGGLFYLINLALSLNLYGDFTTPLRPGIALPLWDFPALLGERLCGERVRGDAVWGLLAGLAGRHEGEPPGRDFTPADAWRVPAEWLAPFRGPRVSSWSDEGGRLRARHAEGFLVLDVPLVTSDGGRQLAEELLAYGGPAGLPLRRARPASDDYDEAEGRALERWLGRLVPYVKARLRRALGVRESGEAARLACEHEARVSVTETRLDVTFALGRLPVEVRLSGLDRDPGWVPAAGRHVAFHYE